MTGNRAHEILARERPLWRQASIDTRLCLIAGLIAATVASAIAISPFVTSSFVSLRVASAYLPTETAPAGAAAGAVFVVDANGNTVRRR